jgi:hypothetical protein
MTFRKTFSNTSLLLLLVSSAFGFIACGDSENGSSDENIGGEATTESTGGVSATTGGKTFGVVTGGTASLTKDDGGANTEGGAGPTVGGSLATGGSENLGGSTSSISSTCPAQTRDGAVCDDASGTICARTNSRGSLQSCTCTNNVWSCVDLQAGVGGSSSNGGTTTVGGRSSTGGASSTGGRFSRGGSSSTGGGMSIIGGRSSTGGVSSTGGRFSRGGSSSAGSSATSAVACTATGGAVKTGAVCATVSETCDKTSSLSDPRTCTCGTDKLWICTSITDGG